LNEATAGLKRKKAEVLFKMADMQAKVAKAAVPVMSEKTAKTAPLRATLDAFLRPARSQSEPHAQRAE
jgi:hypothetical protein